MRNIIFSLSLVTLLSGCLGTALAVSNLALGARSMYCEGTTEGGKQAVANRLTAGQRLVACPAR